MTESDEQRAAKIVAGWYWQMAEGHNFRWKGATKSMTLFYESSPLESDVAQLVIEYLKSRESVTEFVIAHKKWTFDTPWNAKDCWLQTVPSEKWAGTESTKVRVYWALVQNGDEAADGPYTIENGCKYKVSHSYYWDVSSQPTLPASSSGVQYSIQGFTRDRETGLFTYIVEKRETVQQDIPLYESVKTLFEDISEEQHLGVKQDDVAATGLAASVGDGERVERHLTKNPDCTTDITNRKVKDKKVEQARTVVRKELRGTSAATTDRNLTTAEVATKTAAAQEIGETRTVEKTDTDLRNLTVEKFTPAATPITIAESCEKETSVHTDTKVEAVDVANAGPVEQTAETNKRKTVSYKKNDDGKTADKTTTTQTWEEKSGGGSSNSGNGVVTTTTERKENTTTSPTATPGVNKVVEIEETPNDHGSKTTVKRVTEFKPNKKQATGGTVSRTVTVESGVNQTSVPTDAPAVNKEVDVSVSLNDHGSMSTQKRVTQYHPNVKTASGGSAGHTDTVESGINATSVPSGNGGTNVEVDVSVSPNDHGSASYTKRTRTYSPSVRTASGGSAGRSDVVESGINATSVPSGNGGTNVEVDVSLSPNDHGSASYTKRTRTYHLQTAVATSRFATETATTTVNTNTTGDAIADMGNASAHPNDHGSKTTQVTEYTPKPIDSGLITWTSVENSPTHTYTYECGLRVFKNLQAVPTPPGGARVQISANINRYGRYDGSIAYSKLISWAQGGSDGTAGGSQTGSFQYTYVSNYQIKFASSGDLEISPVFSTATISTRTYYGRGNEGSEAQAAANSSVLPGVRLPERTYITSNTTSIVQAMKRAEAKLQAALANRKARGT